MSSQYQYHSELLAPYHRLDQGGSIQAEYVWIGGHGELRCKSKTITHKITDLSQLPNWDFDGSSTDQAPGHDSDVYLRPVVYYKDPFRGGDNILVLASTYNSDGTPNKTNFRHNAAKTMELAKDSVP